MKPFKCTKCSKSYKHKPNLVRHINYECEAVENFACKLCGKSYTEKSILWDHVITLHPDYDAADIGELLLMFNK